MHLKPRFLIGATLLLVLTAASVDAASQFRTLSETADVNAPIREAADLCQLVDHSGTTESYVASFELGDQVVQYFDAVECGSYPFYPFQIDNLAFTLYDDGSGMQWPVTLDVVVYAPITYNDACSGPGDELCRVTVTADSALFAAPNVASVTLDCCVYGAFYIGVEYNDAGPGPFPSILFDDTPAPDTCDNWFYNFDGSAAWEEFYDLTDPALGYPIWWVNGETGASDCEELDLEYWLTIPAVYDSIEWLEGTEVRVIGEYVAPDLPLLVDNYNEFRRDEIMPRYTDMILQGMEPDPIFWYGGSMIVTGIVTSAPDPYPAYEDDTLLITITATEIEYLDGGYGLEVGPEPPKLGRDDFDKDGDCDSCKFAILVSSGGADRWNRPDYWVNLMTLYRHKVDNEDYCPENVFVHFDDGDAQDTSDLADSLVEPAYESALTATHDEISRRIAECRRNGKQSTVQKLFTNHGSDDNGVVLAQSGSDLHYLHPVECRLLQQRLIDSCCAFLYDEFITCYGGDMLDELKNLDNQNKTQIHANSAAPSWAPGWSRVRRITPSGDTVYIPHQYLESKVNGLASGLSYEEAVRNADTDYLDWLYDRVIPGQVQDSTRTEAGIAHWESERERGDSLFLAGSLTVAQWLNWRHICDSTLVARNQRLSKINQRLARLRRQTQGMNDDGTGQGCPSWVRHAFHHYCECKEFVAPPLGELRVQFEGSGGCGNSTVYVKREDGTWQRVRTWNWNLPGSYGYEEGNDERVIHVPLTASGVYRIHNDNGEFNVTVDSYTGRPHADESVSNRAAYAGFSVGCDDEDVSDFGSIVAATHESFGTDEDGFVLSDVPVALSATEGVSYYTAWFTALENNLWWGDMELYLNILLVTQEGPLQIEVPTADSSFQTITITEPGEYTVPLGAIAAPSDGLISFNTDGAVGFIWDSWGLRSRVPTYPEDDCCDIRGDINHDGVGPDIADLVHLVSYMFQPPSDPPGCEDPNNPGFYPEADINGDGIGPDIADLVYLVSYMFQPPSPAPVPCPNGTE